MIHVLIVLGYVSAKILREERYRKIVGKESYHDVSNDNGARIIKFVESKRMVVRSAGMEERH